MALDEGVTSSLKVFGVGPPRTGTHYLASLFVSPIIAVHEHNAIKKIRLLRAYHEQRLSKLKFSEDLLSLLCDREINIDVSHVNYFFLPCILKNIPDARFILTIRDPESWLRSFINHSQRFRYEVQEEWNWLKHFRFDLERWPHSKYEHMLKLNGLFSIDSYLAFYSRSLLDIISNVPEESLLVIPTEHLVLAGKAVTSFLGLPAHLYQLENGNQNALEYKSSIIDELPLQYLRERLTYHCGWICPWLEKNATIKKGGGRQADRRGEVVIKNKTRKFSIPDIAFIQATPPGFNPGMLVSELMAKRFVDRHDMQNRVKFYRLMSIAERLDPCTQSETVSTRCDHGIQYEVLESTEQLINMHPVYWGDFLHMAQYVRNIQPILNKVGTARVNRGAALPERAIRLLMLSDAPKELLRRTISFGTTLAFNTQEDMQDNEYGLALSALVNEAKLFMVRDMVSASNLTAYFGAANVRRGVDVTQMLAIDHCLGNDLSLGSGNIGLIFFGRGAHHFENSKKLLDLLGDSLGIQFEWLEWGDASAFPQSDKLQPFREMFNYREPSSSVTLFDLIDKIKTARLIVTDTYHLSVIGWSLGIPVICIPGEPYGHGSRDVSCGDRYSPIDKRRIFFYQYNLSQYYLEDLRALANIQSDQIEKLVKDITSGYTLRRFSLANCVEASRSEAALLNVFRNI